MSNSMLNITNESKLIAFQVEPNCLHVNANLQCIDCDILALKFSDNIEKSKKVFENFLPKIDKPLMICGCGKDETDAVLLPELIKKLDRECIISFVTEKTYKKVLPYVIRGGHYVVLKTPIDISLAKELNILSIDMGLDKNKIIMNTDIGGLGYGYEYGYSIMEKICQERKKGDEYINMPIISDAGTESLKTKEAKFGEEKRSRMIELTAVSGALAAGANIVLINNADNVKIIRGIF